MDNIRICDFNNFYDIKRIMLVLGMECNMHCRHCVETPFKKYSVEYYPADSVVKTIKNFISYAIQNKVKRHIVFYGGEPLLYWKTIKNLIFTISKKFLNDSQKYFNFVVVTNGTLLTEEMVNFFNAYRVSVCFSYDAPYPFVARHYVSDDICDLVNKIDNLEVYSGFCAHNMDILLSAKCLKAKFPKLKDKPIGAHVMLNRTFDMPKDLYAFDWDKFKLVLKKLRIGAQLGDIDALEFFKANVFDIYKSKFHKDFPGVWIPDCIPLGKELTIFPDGKISFCHNCLNPVGTVEDNMLDIWNKCLTLANNVYKNPNCYHCVHRDICNGVCPFEVRDKNGNFIMCEDFRNHFYNAIKSELLLFNKDLSDEDKKWYQNQEEIMKVQIENFLGEGQRYERFIKNFK